MCFSISPEQSDAIDKYCQLVDELAGQIDEDASSGGQPETYKEIVITDTGGARTILLNRPSKYNAITYKVFLKPCGNH